MLDTTPHFSIIPQIQVTLNCNLACTYCFQTHAGKIINLSTAEQIIEKTVHSSAPDDNIKKTIQVYWHGGEPLLAGMDFFRKIIEIENRFPEVAFENRLQTNGTLLTDEFAAFFVDHGFDLGFSLDGPEDLHNLHRQYKGSKKGSFKATMRGIDLYRHFAESDQIPIIAVVTRDSLDRVNDIYDFFAELRARVQLDIFDIRRLDLFPAPDDKDRIFHLAPSPEEVSHFLTTLFDRWFYNNTRRVDFNELRNEVKMILQPDLIWGDPFHKKRCDFRRTIFDPKGFAFSCDQYINDACCALGNIHKDSIQSIMAKKNRLWEDIKRHVRISSEQMACHTCVWGRQCSGGCMTCMKYNARLLSARSKGLSDARWVEGHLPPSLETIEGEFYYCDGLRLFREHVKKAVQKELAHAGE